MAWRSCGSAATFGLCTGPPPPQRPGTCRAPPFRPLRTRRAAASETSASATATTRRSPWARQQLRAALGATSAASKRGCATSMVSSPAAARAGPGRAAPSSNHARGSALRRDARSWRLAAAERGAAAQARRTASSVMRPSSTSAAAAPTAEDEVAGLAQGDVQRRGRPPAHLVERRRGERRLALQAVADGILLSRGLEGRGAAPRAAPAPPGRASTCLE